MEGEKMKIFETPSTGGRKNLKILRILDPCSYFSSYLVPFDKSF